MFVEKSKMATLKELNRKVNRLKSTRKITNTMKLVAISRIKRMQARQVLINSYYKELIRIATATNILPDTSDWITGNNEGRLKKFLLVITSDHGMCDGFNHILCTTVLKWVKEKAENKDTEIGFYGKKGYLMLKEFFPAAILYQGVTANPRYLDAVRIGTDLQKRFQIMGYSEIWIAYNIVKGKGSVIPVIKKILPIETDEVKKRITAQYLYLKLYNLLVKNAEGEQTARAIAMDSATRNVDELIDKYIVMRNRTRQAVITKELIEVTTGAEVLRSGGTF